MNRLYQPQTAVGEVLMALYDTTGAGDEREQEWATLYQGNRMAALRRQIADLGQWGVPGAPDLADKLAALDKEASSWVFFDYNALLANFDTLEGRTRAVHADWLEYGALRDFVELSWKKVRELYEAGKRIPPSWIEPTLFKSMVAADKAFVAEFSRPDYSAAIKALNRLIPVLKDVLTAAIPINKIYESLRTEVAALKEKQQQVEAQVQTLCDHQRPLEFFATQAGQSVLRMRLRRSQVATLLNGPPQAATESIQAWREAIAVAKAEVEKSVASIVKPGQGAKPELGETIELADLPMEFKMIALVPDEVVSQNQKSEDTVAPKGDTGAPSIVDLKLEVEAAYKALDQSDGDKEKGPLFDAFQKAYGDLDQAVARWNAGTRPTAELAGKRVRELAGQGLLKAMRVDEKIDLLTKLRVSCEPMVVGGPFNKSLTELGQAQAQLLASFELDEEFQKHDRTQREATVKSLVSQPQRKKELLQALNEWTTLPIPQRLKLCRELVAVHCKTLEIEPCPLQPKTESKDTAGYFSPSDRAIFINDHPESAFHYSFEAVSNTLFHETSHWWQHLQVERFNQGAIEPLLQGKPNPEFVQVMLFAYNHGSAHPGAYVSSELGKDLYKRQPMETHAYEAGDEMQQMLMVELLT